ncbi:FN3 domain-containing metallophosphoesterase family protein [uncultured Gimesia sp.]|uniref:FN3 domain-containing metallophosphoesterase family protein n=1 Tax=uncultured Gimesia sp. TaxID=1678688 RepID=UPI0026197780|nr:FN3 domain-containing metallophosphoesterase family protein [uncultured Gimesia sp.]
MKYLILFSCLYLFPQIVSAEEIQQIWLTHKSHEPDQIVVNWLSKEPGDSVVRFGLSRENMKTIQIKEETTLHHVEIPIAHRDTIYFYSVKTGNQKSAVATFKAYPTDELRVAIVADWQSQPDLSHLMKEDVHLLLTAGDNINNLWQKCGPGERDCITPYVNLISAYPKLFRSTPFMPVLGNHDRQIHPRGKKPPAHAVYDIEAIAFRRFFELPDEEWKWHFEIPEFDVRFIGLDFNHISDFGNSWQTCHAFDQNSAQYRWYDSVTKNVPGHLVTLYNERNASIRSQLQGGWHRLFLRGTMCVTGFGYYAERAELDGLTYYNTSLGGKGAQYADPHSKFLAGKDGYLMLTCERSSGKLTVEMKSLQGEILDRQIFSKPARGKIKP